jgi:micrococcal nuclease
MLGAHRRLVVIALLVSALLVAIVGVLCYTGAIADDGQSPVLVGRATNIVDGDTLDVQLDSGPIRVRLHGVDAPEKAQPHGKEATAALSRWVLGKQVEIEPVAQSDAYGRLVGIVYVADTNANAELISSGHAWAFRRYMRNADAKLCELEAEARNGKRGLWSLSEQIAPGNTVTAKGISLSPTTATRR